MEGKDNPMKNRLPFCMHNDKTTFLFNWIYCFFYYFFFALFKKYCGFGIQMVLSATYHFDGPMGSIALTNSQCSSRYGLWFLTIWLKMVISSMHMKKNFIKLRDSLIHNNNFDTLSRLVRIMLKIFQCSKKGFYHQIHSFLK